MQRWFPLGCVDGGAVTVTSPPLSNFETDLAERAGGAFRAGKGKSIEAAERYLEAARLVAEAREACRGTRGKWGAWLARADIRPATPPTRQGRGAPGSVFTRERSCRRGTGDGGSDDRTAALEIRDRPCRARGRRVPGRQGEVYRGSGASTDEASGDDGSPPQMRPGR